MDLVLTQTVIFTSISRSGLKNDYEFPEKKVMFSSKMDTDLFEFVKHKTYATSLTVAPDGKLFAAICNDKKVRIFRFLSGMTIAKKILGFIKANHFMKHRPIDRKDECK